MHVIVVGCGRVGSELALRLESEGHSVAIIDKNARIGRGVRITNEAGIVESEEAPHYVIRDQIVVIPKQTILQHNVVI